MKIKILEVNNIDLLGRRFNGYDLMHFLNKNEKFDVKQVVIHKKSEDNNVISLTFGAGINLIARLKQQEDSILSVHSVLSITSPLLRQLKEYKEADIIHFHMFHNSNFSLSSLKQICEEKKVVISLHDPWFMTGRCVHPYDCEKWKQGCKGCEHLNTLFPMRKDNAQYLWNLKKDVFSSVTCDLIVSSKFMEDMVKDSPILNKQKVHFIPLGIDLKEFYSTEDNGSLRNKYNIPKKGFVYFLRAQQEFKGTEYILEALKKIKPNKNMVFIICDATGMLDEVKDKFTIIDLGVISDNKKLLELYQLCDVFLMPSLGESFGYMAIEAMACEKPVIVFDNSALPSVTFAPKCGILVKNRDSDDLAKAIIDIKENKDDRIRRGKLSRKIVEENYNIDDYHLVVEKLYFDIIKRKKKKKVMSKKIKSDNQKEIDVLKGRLRTINNNLEIPEKFSFLKNGSKYFFHKNDVIDYGNEDVQKMINDYNQELVKYIDVGGVRHPIKTAFNLLVYDRKKLVDTIKNKLKGGS